MTGWDELVTTALLGTDRRPLPTDLAFGWAAGDPQQAARDPAATVLDLAAAHRALSQAGTRLPTESAPDSGPPDHLTLAPRRAQDVMAGLLAKPEPGLVNLWLAVCAECGLGLATELWPRLAQLASRSTAYDRRLLARVVGPRGGWFLRQNPAWARLVQSFEPEGSPEDQPPPDRAISPGPAEAASAPVSTPTETMRQILAHPDPLPLELTEAALRLVVGGALGPETLNAARALGPRITIEVWADLPAAMTTDGLAETGAPTTPLAQLSLALIHRAVQARIEIEDAFRPPTGETTP